MQIAVIRTKNYEITNNYEITVIVHIMVKIKLYFIP